MPQMLILANGNGGRKIQTERAICNTPENAQARLSEYRGLLVRGELKPEVVACESRESSNGEWSALEIPPLYHSKPVPL